MGKEVIEHQRKINWEGSVEVSVEFFMVREKARRSNNFVQQKIWGKKLG